MAENLNTSKINVWAKIRALGATNDYRDAVKFIKAEVKLSQAELESLVASRGPAFFNLSETKQKKLDDKIRESGLRTRNLEMALEEARKRMRMRMRALKKRRPIVKSLPVPNIVEEQFVIIINSRQAPLDQKAGEYGRRIFLRFSNFTDLATFNKNVDEAVEKTSEWTTNDWPAKIHFPSKCFSRDVGQESLAAGLKAMAGVIEIDTYSKNL